MKSKIKKGLISYKSGYKYQLVEDYTVKVALHPQQDIITEYIILTTKGILTIKKGYAWDGPSGPTFDTKTFMRGSLVHDALYQLIRQIHLSNMWRGTADKELKRICIEDGMSRIRAWWVFNGVALGGASAASPRNRKIVHKAP